MSSRERLTLAVALAVALGAAAVVPLYADLGWVTRAAGGILAVAVAGLLTRRANLPGSLQPVVAIAALLFYVCLVFARTTLAYGLLPTGDTVDTINNLLQAGLTDIDRLAPPVPTNTGLTLIAVLGVGAVAIVVDLIAVVFGRAAIAGLPLLVLYAVPSAVLPGGLGSIPFVFVAAGWMWLMLVEGSDRVSRWGTPLKTDRNRSARYDDASLGRVGRRIGAAALGVAVVVPAMIPGLDARLLGGVGGDGNGKGSRTTTTYNPITKLRDDLRLPKPHQVLTYTTDAKSPDYLRMTTLDQFSDAGWSSSRLSGSTQKDGVEGTLPVPHGLSAAKQTKVKVKVRIRNLDAQWLPVPAVPSKVDVEGPWLYDGRSETVYSIRSSTKKVKDQYTVTAIKSTPDRNLLGLGIEPDDDDATIRSYARDPGDEVTPYVRELTERVIKGKQSAYEKVAAIQAFFSPTHGFKYSTTTQVAGIDSPSALESFLRGRRGFCEQYASAMAAMIRIANVPARVAVGFTAGRRGSNGTYVVTTDDAHAWPEAWFGGAGWVRFEPTPRRDGQTTVPAYATPADANADGAGQGGQPDLPEPDAGVTGEDTPVLAPRDRPDLDVGVDPGAAGARTHSTRRSIALVLAIAVTVLVILPRLLHVVRRRRRWRTGGALAGWAQVQDDAIDIGHQWRPADSPRAAAAALAQRHALGADARAALGRLALAAERTRYARDKAADTEGLYDDATVVRSALRSRGSRLGRWRTWLLPPSTLRWAASTLGTFVADVLDGIDNVWSSVRHLGRTRPHEV
jgi:transglutaminase-like putative cysteine protease